MVSLTINTFTHVNLGIPAWDKYSMNVLLLQDSVIIPCVLPSNGAVFLVCSYGMHSLHLGNSERVKVACM